MNNPPKKEKPSSVDLLPLSPTESLLSGAFSDSSLQLNYQQLDHEFHFNVRISIQINSEVTLACPNYGKCFILDEPRLKSLNHLWFGSLSAQEQLTVEMAFYGRLGSLMRQTVSQPSGQVPMSSMLDTIRCMSSTKLTIKGLTFGTNDDSLKDASSGFAWKIGLPKSRVLYTVLRSPHIDKKSREQFEMVTKKKLLVMNTDSHELRQKLFWLKRQRIFGTQCEILVSCKTRLDKGQVVDALQRSSPTGIRGDQEGLVASSAVSAMDGQHNIRVSYANDRSPAPRGYGGCSGSYRGGFGDARENDDF
ncbi:hypothetical protein RHMOL_Rhmol06G0305700 [Rhododendron molle]|uniref:Uncharacterized protein n=1 Tax=Rhododendron molle TaxID=49168 RepID=A0ACC0NK99_RHOML|nr:hypothetical protein RHMOL_Rhmol06G0305700 [Rhododendron molle]